MRPLAVLDIRSAALGFSFFILSLVASASEDSLRLQALQGTLIHDATYLPQPDWWPDFLEWDGIGLNDDPSYRYGASMMRYAGDNLHFWSCSEGDADLNIADYIRYRHSSNGGRTWTEDEIVLSPTIGSDDGWAVCDPNVVKFNGYYYMAYTATDDSNNFGLNNDIYIARSSQANGPFVKWNGSAWSGDDPKAIIQYQGPVNRWGYGEPNMVIVNDMMYLYYTDGEAIGRTRVATTNINNPNWPNLLADQGYAISSRDNYEDQTDVKYLPEVDLFIATAIANRFMPQSYVHVWWSTDGLTFQPISEDRVTTNIQATAHNLAMSGNELGHAKMGSHEYISYSYTGPDGEWGIWNTWLNPIKLTGAGWVPSEANKRIGLMTLIMLLLGEEETE